MFRTVYPVELNDFIYFFILIILIKIAYIYATQDIEIVFKLTTLIKNCVKTLDLLILLFCFVLSI